MKKEVEEYLPEAVQALTDLFETLEEAKDAESIVSYLHRIKSSPKVDLGKIRRIVIGEALKED